MYWKNTHVIKTKHVAMIGLAVTDLSPLINGMPYPSVMCAPTIMAGILHHRISGATLPVGGSQAVTESTRTGR